MNLGVWPSLGKLEGSESNVHAYRAMAMHCEGTREIYSLKGYRYTRH